MTLVFMAAQKIFRGWEYDWGAIDINGCLGYFQSAGFGPIPQIYNDKLDGEFDLEELVLQRPIVTECVQVSDFNGGDDILTWLDIAKRGFFSYDWCRTKKHYYLVAAPQKPIFRKDINNDLIDEFLVTEFDWEFDESHKNGVELKGVKIE